MRTVEIRKRLDDQLKIMASKQSRQTILATVDELVRASVDDNELEMMAGRVRFLGEPYMLYTSLEFIVGMQRQPLMRAAAIDTIQKTLKKYLGLDFKPTPAKIKRKRRKLLRHV